MAKVSRFCLSALLAVALLQAGIVAQAFAEAINPPNVNLTFGNSISNIPMGTTTSDGTQAAELSSSEIPSVPNQTFTITSGIAKNQTISLGFAGWMKDSISTAGLQRVGNVSYNGAINTIYTKADIDALRSKESGNEPFAYAGMKITQDTHFVPIFTADVVFFTLRCREYSSPQQNPNTGDIEWQSVRSLVDESDYVPVGFEVTEALSNTWLNQAKASAHSSAQWEGRWHETNVMPFPTTLQAGKSYYHCTDFYVESNTSGSQGGTTSTPDETDKPDTSSFTNISVEGNTSIKVRGDLTGQNVSSATAVSAKVQDIATNSDFILGYDAISRGNRPFAAYSVTLVADGVAVHNDFGTLELAFPVDAWYNGKTLRVYHIHQDGSITSSTSVAQDGFVSITVTDLSTFVLAEEVEGLQSAMNALLQALPQTGDSRMLFQVLAVAFLAAAVIFLCGARKSFQRK